MGWAAAPSLSPWPEHVVGAAGPALATPRGFTTMVTVAAESQLAPANVLVAVRVKA